MDKQLRQGDVFLMRVDSLPAGATIEKSAGGDIILAHGEATGHAHRVECSNASLYKIKGERLLQVTRSTELKHEEHGPITLSPGVYKIVIQREYSPSVITQVLD